MIPPPPSTPVASLNLVSPPPSHTTRSLEGNAVEGPIPGDVLLSLTTLTLLLLCCSPSSTPVASLTLGSLLIPTPTHQVYRRQRSGRAHSRRRAALPHCPHPAQPQDKQFFGPAARVSGGSHQPGCNQPGSQSADRRDSSNLLRPLTNRVLVSALPLLPSPPLFNAPLFPLPAPFRMLPLFPPADSLRVLPCCFLPSSAS
ncbi:unnamed protein product [Closterium sp. NIES-54]